jgi:hypothetical protein
MKADLTSKARIIPLDALDDGRVALEGISPLIRCCMARAMPFSKLHGRTNLGLLGQEVRGEEHSIFTSQEFTA